MIIVNQDKTGIINFDNVMCIEVIDMEEDGYSVTAEVVVGVDDIYKELGYYKTEERAKEILQEIVQRISDWEYLKAGQPQGVCSFIYKMPKE